MAPQPAGNFFLVEVHGVPGRLIRFFQWLNGNGFRRFEHAGMALGNGQLIEAEPGRKGARIREQSEYDGTNIVWSDWALTTQQRADADREGRALEGMRYSWLDYLALVLHRFRIPVPGLRQFIESTKRGICSQLVDLISARAKIQLFADGRWFGYVTPGSLYRALHGPVTS
jgi:hypothetical protein